MGSIKQVTAMMEPAAKVNRGALTLLGGILLIAAALRVSAAAGDLWVDEVWSLYNIGRARTAASPGNWLALSGEGRMSLVLTFYDTPIASSTGVSDIELPAIINAGCNG